MRILTEKSGVFFDPFFPLKSLKYTRSFRDVGEVQPEISGNAMGRC